MIENWIREEAAKLETFYNRITACRVAIEVPHRRQKNAKPLQVCIDVTLPGKEIVIKREPVSSRGPQTIREGDALIKLHPLPPHHDLHLVIHAAFKVAARRIREFARYRRENVKTHEQFPATNARRIPPEEGYSILNAGD